MAYTKEINHRMTFSNPEFADMDRNYMRDFSNRFKQLYMNAYDLIHANNTVNYLDQLNNMQGVKLTGDNTRAFLDSYLQTCEEIWDMESLEKSNGGKIEDVDWEKQYSPKLYEKSRELEIFYSWAKYPEQRFAAVDAYNTLISSLQDPATHEFIPMRPEKIGELCAEAGLYNVLEPDPTNRIMLENGTLQFRSGMLAGESADNEHQYCDLDQSILIEVWAPKLEEYIKEMNDIEIDYAEKISNNVREYGHNYTSVSIVSFAASPDFHSVSDFQKETPYRTSVFMEIGDRVQNIQLTSEEVLHRNNYGYSAVSYVQQTKAPYQIMDPKAMMPYALSYDVSIPNDGTWENILENISISQAKIEYVDFDTRNGDLQISNSADLIHFQIIEEGGISVGRGDNNGFYYPSEYLAEHVPAIQALARDGKSFKTFGDLDKAVTDREMKEMLTMGNEQQEIGRQIFSQNSLDDILVELRKTDKDEPPVWNGSPGLAI